MEQFLKLLSQSLEALPSDSGRYAVAFSGGVDSAVLLAALTRLVPRPEVRALHIDHGLHPDSGAWVGHCRVIANTLGADCVSRQVHIENKAGESLEALAREARYQALGELITPGEILLTAHHSDDQLETLLFRLFRGSGVKGLRGIAEFKRFRAGFLARPMLRISREEILVVARAWQLDWLEDPMNQDIRLDRNFLRAEILPQINKRWPAANKTVGRTAQQMTEAQELLDGVAEVDGRSVKDAARVRQADLLVLPAPRQRNLLRYLIARLGLPTPAARQLDTLLKGLRVQRADAETQVQWPGGEARIYRGVLYLFPPLGEGSGDGYAGEIGLSRSWTGPEGSLFLVRGTGPGLPDAWVKEGLAVRFRVGGERFKPLLHDHSRPLKKWLQDAGVLPWLRGRIPLLYHNDQLVAVGDLWISATVSGLPDSESGWQISWINHPQLT